MPLVDLVTDLKSLRYGKDTPGGGNSGQPYIQAKIPDGLAPKSPDFLLRNGYLAPLDALEDIRRLGKMFSDLKSFNGAGFIAKQNVLSNSAVRTQASGVVNEFIYTPLSTLAQAGVVAFGGHLNKQGINPFRETGAYAQGDYLYFNQVKPNPNDPGGSTTNNRLVSLYTAISSSTSTELSGFTLNGNGGPTPTNVLSYKGGPGAPLGVGNTNIRFADQRTGKNNPLASSDYFKGKYTKQFTPGNYLKSIGTTVRAGTIIPLPLDNTGVSGKYIRLTNDRLINNFNDQGKPVGDYFHNVYEPAIEGNTWPKNTPLIYANNTFTYTQENLIQTKINPPTGDHLSPKIQDFRKVLRASLGQNATKASNLGATPDTPSYQNQNIEKRVNIGSIDGAGPGSRANKSYVSYTNGVQFIDGNGNSTGPVGAQDRINALPIYRSNFVQQNSTEYPVNDLVKFRIAAIDGSNPQFKTFMHFRAFIDSFSDSYNASWDSVRYLGRGENFYNYNGFDRTISLSFTVAAQSKPELIPMYKKLNYLASNLTPDYSPFGYMRGPLVQLTMGGYLYEQVGFITALTYDIPNDTTWEIGINDAGGSDNTVKELPHRINVSNFNFTPIHNFVPGKQGLGFNDLALNDSSDSSTGFATGYGNQRYIALTAGAVSNYDSDERGNFIPPSTQQLEEEALLDQIDQLTLLNQSNSSFNI